ncbi:MAG: 30S ribosomal protein S16 [Armatimonadota bacterium]|nr:MAG: 30S ribosomal protein S16 [Armatimonadota bacterium]
MAVRLRLRRIGKKKQPQYRLVAAEAAGPRDGRFIEVLGQYNPQVDPSAVSVNEERALWWLQQGAQPTDTAKSLLVRTGVWEKFTGEPAPAPRVSAPEGAVEPAASEEELSAGGASEEAAALGAEEPSGAVEESASSEEQVEGEEPKD